MAYGGPNRDSWRLTQEEGQQLVQTRLPKSPPDELVVPVEAGVVPAVWLQPLVVLVQSSPVAGEVG